MILGVGIDLVEVARIRASLDRFGDRFAQRILRPEEAAYCHGLPEPAIHLAARFAAKEAVAKAFGTGLGAELGWLDLEVTRGETGQPGVRLHGAGLELARRRGVVAIHLSLTHTATTAAAVAILES